MFIILKNKKFINIKFFIKNIIDLIFLLTLRNMLNKISILIGKKLGQIFIDAVKEQGGEEVVLETEVVN